MNGVSKIKKFLDENGYSLTYIKMEYYRHYSNFHRGSLYGVAVYKTSNDYYIKVKDEGKPLYTISKTNNDFKDLVGLDFSQKDFLRRFGHLFPPTDLKGKTHETK